MNARFFKNSVAARVIIGFIVLNFVLTSGPVGIFTEVFASSNFRKSQTKGSDAGIDLANSLTRSPQFDGGDTQGLRTITDLKKVLKAKGINSGFAVGDWNVGREGDVITDDSRGTASLDFFRSIFGADSQVQELFFATHSGRPDEVRAEIEAAVREELKQKGITDERSIETAVRQKLMQKFGMKPIVATMQAMFNQDDVLKDVALVLLPVNLEDEAQVAQFIAQARQQYPGQEDRVCL